jgi:predicted AAA+ superfamily ATPase
MLVKDFSPFASRPDAGVLAESVVEASLRRRLQPNEELHFWRTKQGDKVDFVLCRDRITVPIEVKVTFRGSQDFRGLHKFLDAYPDAPAAYLLTLEDSSSEPGPAEYSYSARTIFVRPCQSAASMEFFV